MKITQNELLDLMEIPKLDEVQIGDVRLFIGENSVLANRLWMFANKEGLSMKDAATLILDHALKQWVVYEKDWVASFIARGIEK
jgi:hypothetical protein